MQGRVAPIYPAVPQQSLGQALPTGTTNGFPNYSRHPNLGLAATQLTLGILSITFNIVGIIIGAALTFIGIGIWGGTMIVIAGSFGIAAAHYRTKCAVITTLVMSILSSLMGLGLALNSIFGMIFDSDWNYYDCYYLCSSFNGCLVVFGLIEMIIAIIQAAFCCKQMGSSTNPTYQVVTVNSLSMPTGPASTNQELFLNIQGQLVPVYQANTESNLGVMGAAPYPSAAAAYQNQPPAYHTVTAAQAPDNKDNHDDH